MTNPLRALNDNFYYNNRMAHVALPLLQPNERKMMQVWIDKLLSMDKSTDQMLMRSDYMWFLLLMMQSKRIREPFTKLPPTELPPLKKIVPLQTYEEILLANEPNMLYSYELNRALFNIKFDKKKSTTSNCNNQGTIS